MLASRRPLLMILLATLLCGLLQASVAAPVPDPCKVTGCPLPPCNAAAPPAADAVQPADREGIPAGNVVRSFWGGPPSTQINDARFREVADAGFNVAFPIGANNATTNRLILQQADAHHLTALVKDIRMPSRTETDVDAKSKSLPAGGGKVREVFHKPKVQTVYNAYWAAAIAPLTPKDTQSLDAIIKDYAGCHALLGYFVVDEPTPNEQLFYANVVNYFRAHDPTHLAYVNHESRNQPATMGGEMGAFADATGTQVLSYDYYPFYQVGLVPHDKPDFLRNLNVARNVTLAHSTASRPVQFWDFVQLASHKTQWWDYRNLTEGELRYESMQSFAHGSRGVLYFTYWTASSTANTEFRDDGIILGNGKESRHYGEVQRINQNVTRIGRYLANMVSTGVSTNPMGAVAFGGTATNPVITSLTLAGPTRVTVGAFEMPSGTGTTVARNYALLANSDYTNATTVAFTIGGTSSIPDYLDIASEAWKPVLAAGVDLAPGGAVLVRW